MSRLDSRDILPSGMEEYLSTYGWHFSKKMCEWAVSKMKKSENGKLVNIQPFAKEDVKNLFTSYGMSLEKDYGYDCVYVANMCRADFVGSSIIDDYHLVLFVKDMLEDPDGYEGMVFTRFYADCIGSGTPIIWEDMI